MYEDIDAIKAAHKGHWFDRDSMTFFGSMLPAYAAWPLPGGAYFISSEKYPSGYRAYSIQWADCIGEIHTVGEFMAYETLREAMAEVAALFRNDVSWTHCKACGTGDGLDGDRRSGHHPYVPSE